MLQKQWIWELELPSVFSIICCQLYRTVWMFEAKL